MTEEMARTLARHLRGRGAVAIATTSDIYGVEPAGIWITVANGVVIRDREELRGPE